MTTENSEIKTRETPLPAEQWEWFGLAAHFICGRWCRFHMATKVGEYIVSTVGLYVHPSDSGSSESAEAEFFKRNPLGQDIGCGRKFETMVFRFTHYCETVECNCGLPRFDPNELDFRAANAVREARDNHMTLCKKWAQYV